MEEAIELSLDCPDGTVDCRLEPYKNETEQYYSATILYPNTVGGFSRSEVYCCNLRRGTKMGDYFFENGEDVLPPKVKKLETQLSRAIVSASEG